MDMATAKELRDQADVARIKADGLHAEALKLAAEARKAERAERDAKRKAEADEHFNQMFDEIGKPLAGLNEKQHGLVYGFAYSMGHASGFGEVEGHYGDLAELVRAVIEAK